MSVAGTAAARPSTTRCCRNQAFVDFAIEWWPPLDAPTVLSWLRDPDFLARVAEGVLSGEDQRLLAKSWGSSVAEGALPDFSVEDVPLLDELRYALGDVPARHEDDHQLDDHVGADLAELTTAADREYAPTGRAWAPPTHRIEDDGFAHVLVDEAQDLSPMQWRMVGRRGRAASWTIVGDPAQSSWPVPEESAAARADALEGKALHEFHLSTNYRNSSEIYAHAAAYAERVGLDADLPTAVRSTGVPPQRSPTWPTWSRRPGRPSPRSPGRCRRTSRSSYPSPAAPRSTPGWRRGPSSPPTAPAARAAVDSTTAPSGDDRVVCSPAWTPRPGVRRRSWWGGRQRDRGRRRHVRPGPAALATLVLTRATQLLTTIS